MNISRQHTQVLIVGAGPSGLMMAAQLLRYGIEPVIIDSKKGPTDQSRALAVQARSLEIYRQMGLADKVLQEGKQAQGVEMFVNGAERARLRLDEIEGITTPYNYVLMYPQHRNERDLLTYLTQHCCPVYWDTTLITLSQTKNTATAIVKTGDEEHTLTADWVIGADGAHSSVRKQLDIPFKGDTYKKLFYLIDGKLDASLDTDVVRLHLSGDGLAAFFPLPGIPDYFRIVGSLPESYQESEEELTLEKVTPWLNKATGKEYRVTDCRWFTSYRLHHRMASRFAQGRCFLIGDAAHIHSPVGGQGMNTGLQDAYNLAWKLAGVLNNRLKPTVLDTYPAERMPLAQRLLNTTDRAFNFATSNSWFVGLFKKYLLAHILNKAWKNNAVRNFFFRTVSQTAISYRASVLSLHLSQAKLIKAGDRLPCLKLYDEKRRTETDLHDWCAKPGFTLLLLGKIIEEELFMVAKWLTQRYGVFINFYYLPPSEKNQPVFNAFEIGPGQHRSILVRPDMHIGFMNDAIDLDRMDNYLQNIAGVIKV